MQKFTGETWQLPQHITFTPDIGAISLAPSKEVAASLKQRLQATDQLLWITDEFPEAGLPVDEGVDFNNVEAWKKGRKDSLQGVFFGRLAVGNEAEVPVAVKPFLSAIGPGIHETALLLYLEGRELPVYKVLGASWTEEQGYSMITAFEQKSKSLDNIDWTKDVDTPIGEHLTILEAVEQIGQSLGMMHGNGVIHFDAQVKNFAVIDDRVVLIDLAQARMMANEGRCDEAALEGGMYRDLSRLMESLTEKGFFRSASDEERNSFFNNVIATAYRSGLYRTNNALEETYGVDQHAMVERVLGLFNQDEKHP